MTPTPRMRMRRAGLPIALIAACLAAAGCGGDAPSAPTAPPLPTELPTEQPTLKETSAEGVLAPPDRAEDAFTYDPALAPEGARMSVEAGEADGATRVRLQVQGFLPNRGYAVHAHARPCGPTGDAAGPHYQHMVDPAAGPQQPSIDPAFANPNNEIWLDLRTDANGNAEISAQVPFVFADRAPASVVIHANEATATEPGKAGTAGPRVACLDVPFA